MALPLAILVIAGVTSAVFYGRLPQSTGWQFSGGVPVSQVSRGAFLGWALGLQIMLCVVAFIIVFVIVSAGRRMQLTASPLNRTLIGIMGNIVAMPQLIIYYAVLDIFLNNIYGKSLPPLWVFGIAVLFIGALVIFSVFITAFLKSRAEKIQEKTGS